MRQTSTFFTIVTLTLSLSAGCAFATPYDTLQSIAGTYNVFLLGNLGTASAPYSVDSQGPVAVAGSAWLSNASVGNGSGSAALVVGGALTQTGGTDYGNVFVGGNATITNGTVSSNLIVGGSLTQSGGQDSGNVFVGGAATNLASGATISGSLNLTGANSSLNANTSQYTDNASSPSAIYVTASTQVHDQSYWTTAKTSGGPATPTAPLDVFGSSTDLQNASTSLATTTATQTINFSGGTLNLTLTGNGSNIIDLNVPSGTSISTINITTASGVTPTGVIINVNGNNVSFSGGFNSSLSPSQVLFNFSNATALSLSSIGFNASLLAPLANVSFSSGNIDGTLIANTYTGTAQFDSDGGFNDPLPTYPITATPEPASIAVFGVGLVGLGLLMRRRTGRERVEA